jgi:hypothetical protein
VKGQSRSRRLGNRQGLTLPSDYRGSPFHPDTPDWFRIDDFHGTFCAGINGCRAFSPTMIGIAPRCDLYALRVNKNNSGRSNTSPPPCCGRRVKACTLCLRVLKPGSSNYCKYGGDLCKSIMHLERHKKSRYSVFSLGHTQGKGHGRGRLSGRLSPRAITESADSMKFVELCTRTPATHCGTSIKSKPKIVVTV